MYKAKIFLLCRERTRTPPNPTEVTIHLKPVEIMFYEEPTEELVKDTLATFVRKDGDWWRLPNDTSLKFEAEECGE